MNKTTIYTLKALRKLYIKLYGIKSMMPICESDFEKASHLIYNALIADKPCMLARFGATELACLMNYNGVNVDKKQIVNYIKGETNPWWWDKNIINQMMQWSGFFPPTIDKIEQFCALILNDIPQIDILGSWLEGEKIFNKELMRAKKIHLFFLDPFWSDKPWTNALKNKKVLVVHPFKEEIESQFKIKDKLFSKKILPDFNLITIKAVQSIAGEKTEFNDWFEALEHMKNEIDKVDYDICLIGAGAYGFHLAAHVKRSGKKAVHIGGSLQLLFGIKGKRWEDPNYGVKEWGLPKSLYSGMMNEFWVRPGFKAKPLNSDIVEDSCYW